MYIEQNLKGLCEKFGIDYQLFLKDFEVDHPNELNLFDLEAVCEEYEVDLYSLIFKQIFPNEVLKKRIKNIKFLVLDVDGVLTDEGMYVSEKGDQLKKYNTKDGMAIIHLTSKGFPVALLSSGITEHMVQDRAALLGINHCYVGKESKLKVLIKWCNELNINSSEVAYIGDDINDIEVLKEVGISACPKNASNRVKTICDIMLSKNGGAGCVREFIDNYLLNEPI